MTSVARQVAAHIKESPRPRHADMATTPVALREVADRIDFCAEAWRLFDSAPSPSLMAQAAGALYAGRKALPPEALELLAGSESIHGFAEAVRADFHPRGVPNPENRRAAFVEYEASSIKVFLKGAPGWPYEIAFPLPLIDLLFQLGQRVREAGSIEATARLSACFATLDDARRSVAIMESRVREHEYLEAAGYSVGDLARRERRNFYSAQRVVAILEGLPRAVANTPGARSIEPALEAEAIQ